MFDTLEQFAGFIQDLEFKEKPNYHKFKKMLQKCDELSRKFQKG